MQLNSCALQNPKVHVIHTNPFQRLQGVQGGISPRQDACVRTAAQAVCLNHQMLVTTA